MPYKIISGQYELGTKEQQAGYQMLFGRTNTQYIFDLYFHWYNIAHEIGHCLLHTQKITLSKVQEEMFANEFASAYWKYIGAEMRMSELETILKEILSIFPSPVPPDSSFTAFYESIWETEALNSVAVYGFFQLNSVLEASQSNKSFKTVLETIGIDLDHTISMEFFDGTICAANAVKVLNSIVRNINKLILSPIQISMELVDNPMIQCARPCE